MKDISISIIIPTYQRKVLLKRCVEQILSQICGSDEIIVCNDDRNEALSHELFGWDRDIIRIIENNGPRGPSGTRNTGALAAKNDILLFMDDDDFMRSGYINSLKSTLIRHPNSDYGGSNIQLFSSEKALEELPLLNNEIAELVTRPAERLIGSGCGMWFNKALFLDLGMFDINLKNTEDNDICMRATARKAYCHKFKQPWICVNRVQHKEMSSLTNITPLKDKIQNWWKVYEKSRTLLPFYNGVRITLLERFIRRSVRLGYRSKALKTLLYNAKDPLTFIALTYWSFMSFQNLMTHIKSRSKYWY